MIKDKSSALAAFTAAVMCLQGVSKKTEANSLDQQFGLDYKYSNYKEGEIPADKLSFGSAERYTIDVHQLKFKAPLSTSAEVHLGLTQEAMTGASPWWVEPVGGVAGNLPVQVMSGATIDETRTELNADFRIAAGDSFENTVSLGFSNENDYQSLSFGYSGAVAFNQKLTTLSFGFNTSKDYLDPTDGDLGERYPGRIDDEVKSRYGFFLGLSRVFTKNRLVGATVGASVLDGFLSDPYKRAWVDNTVVADARPDTNNQVFAAVQWREFIPSVSAALHVDYRYFTNDWGVESHTGEVAWYQNLGAGFQLVPSYRYYQQTAAEFYEHYYIATRADGFYSSDYRLSEYSAFSGQLKLVYTYKSFSVNLAYEAYETDGDNPGLINYSFASLGTSIRF
jgi:Protein of unknown function (DUF3570)